MVGVLSATPLAVLGMIVAVHELGHMLGAMAVGIKVHRFSIFFGPPLIEWSWREINMKVGTIPLGGFVQASMQPDDDASCRGESVEEKPWWQQLVFYGCGIMFNVGSALGLLALLSTSSMRRFNM